MSNIIPRRILCSGWESHLGHPATQSRLRHPYPSFTITPTVFQLYVQDKGRVKKGGMIRSGKKRAKKTDLSKL